MRISRNSEMIKDDMIEALIMMGFEHIDFNFYRRIEQSDDSQIIMYGQLYDDSLLVNVYADAIEIDSQVFKFPIKFIDYIEELLSSYGIENIKLIPYNPKDRAITASNTTKDFIKKLIRVKSSNVWSYAFQPRTDQIGDMLMQFKGSNGGPGDIYIYYDVPSKLWRKFVAAPSKGHFMWEYIRNVFKYAKLTGDKRTHLPNGI